MQEVEGKQGFTTALVGRGNALCNLASTFGQETFNTIDEDALDAVGEVVNCINGLVATSMEHLDNTLELCPPEFSTEAEAVSAEEMLILPLRVLGKKIDFVITLGNKLELK